MEQDRKAAYLFVAYAIVVIAALLVLRASVDAVDFLSVGWILVLAALPLLPWLLPRLGEFLRTISPYVQGIRLGLVQLDLRAVRSEPVIVPTGGALAAVPNDVSALSASTTIMSLVAALRDLRRQGGSPVGVIDLRNGDKWRLPNLYMLARLLESEPVVSELVFTEMSGGVDGYLVGTCRPDDLRRQIELALPAYAAAAATLSLPVAADLDEHGRAEAYAAAFRQLRQALGSGDDTFRLVDPGWLADLPDLLSTAAVETPGHTLTETDLRTIIEARHRYVPTTARRRLTGVIDQQTVALAVARHVLVQAHS